MTVPNLPERKLPGWLYAALFLITVVAYVALVIAGHSGDTPALLLVTAPVLSGVFVADRVSATTRAEAVTTRTTVADNAQVTRAVVADAADATKSAITNGALTAGLLNALDHPDVVSKLLSIMDTASASAVAKAVEAKSP